MEKKNQNPQLWLRTNNNANLPLFLFFYSDRRSSKVPPSRRYKPPELSKSVEVLDKETSDSLKTASKKNLDNRSQSELDVWQGAQRSEVASAAHGAVISSISQPTTRRGSLGQMSGSSSSGGQISDLLNEDERWSWKGSFESALAMENQSMKSQKSKSQKSIVNEPTENNSASGAVEPTSASASNPQQTAGVSARSARFKPSMIIDTQNPQQLQTENGQNSNNVNKTVHPNYSTSSLPRLGTSSIKKQAGPPKKIETSEATLELSVPPKKTNIATNAGAGPPRSARYRPHGYRPPPPPTRKTSPNSRKSSVDSVNRFPGRNKNLPCVISG